MPDGISELEDESYGEGYADGMRAAVPIVLADFLPYKFDAEDRERIDAAIETAIKAQA